MNSETIPAIPAIIAAAGFSRRMGEFKQLLPWGSTTVIRAVADTLEQAGAAPILCVTGHRAEEVAAALAGSRVRLVANPDYGAQEMLASYQAGVRALLTDGSPYDGALLALGDQPHLGVESVVAVLDGARAHKGQIVIPSFQMRRGHPIYLPAGLWPDLLALHGDESLRTLLGRHPAAVFYVTVASDDVLRDMDTPQAYSAEIQRYRREAGGT